MVCTFWCQHISSYNPKADNMCIRGQLKCDVTRAETRFRLLAKWTSPFKSAGASVQLTTGSWGVHICGNNAGYTMFRGSVKGTDYLLHSPVSPSLPLPCITICHHISVGVYKQMKYLHMGTVLHKSVCIWWQSVPEVHTCMYRQHNYWYSQVCK